MSSRWVPRPPRWLGEAVQRDRIRCVDVGARGGWQPRWRAYDEYVTFVGFEPDTAECERLRAQARPNEIYSDKGLYHTDAEVSLYHCEPASMTSIYKPDLRVLGALFGEAPRITRVETIPVTTLDRAMQSLAAGTIDFIKLDTQGSELDILRGAEAALAGPLLALQVEVEFAPLYENQPLFAEVASFLRARAFDFIDFESQHRSAWIRFGNRRGRASESLPAFLRQWGGLVRAGGGLRGGQRLIYADAVFMREPQAWFAAVARCEDPRSVGLRGLLTACILGYYEQAFEIAGVLHEAKLLADDELAGVTAFIEDGQRMIWRAASDVARVSTRLAQRLLRWSGDHS